MSQGRNTPFGLQTTIDKFEVWSKRYEINRHSAAVEAARYEKKVRGMYMGFIVLLICFLLWVVPLLRWADAHRGICLDGTSTVMTLFITTFLVAAGYFLLCIWFFSKNARSLKAFSEESDFAAKAFSADAELLRRVVVHIGRASFNINKELRDD